MNHIMFNQRLNAFVELFVRDLSIVDVNFVADNEGWLGLAGNDQVSQVAIVLLDVALTCRE